MRDGKAIIIEGQHLDPSMYLRVLRGPGSTSREDSDQPTARQEALDRRKSASPPHTAAKGGLAADVSGDDSLRDPRDSGGQGGATVMLRLSEMLGALEMVERRQTDGEAVSRTRGQRYA